MLRLLSTLRSSVLVLGATGVRIHVEHAAQHGGPLLRQMGSSLGTAAAAATASTATAHLHAVHLQRVVPCSLAFFSTSQQTARTASGTAAGAAATAGLSPSSSAAAATGRRQPSKHQDSRISDLGACSTLDACLQTLQEELAKLDIVARSSSSSSSSSSVRPAVVDGAAQEQGCAALRAAVKPGGEHWLLVRCGEWLSSSQDVQQRGLSGPALALLQVFEVEDGIIDSTAWRLGADGHPTGETYRSISEFELLTSKGPRRKYITSCIVLNSPAAARGSLRNMSLRTWLETRYGEGTRLARKHHPRGPSSPNPGHSAAEHGSRTHPKQHSSRKASLAQPQEPYRARHAAANRIASYTGRGAPAPGDLAAQAQKLAAAAAAVGNPAQYNWPAAGSPPAPLATQLNMDRQTVIHRQNIVDNIAAGLEDLSETHVPLLALLPPSVQGAAAAAAAAAAGMALQQLVGPAGMEQRQPAVAAAAAAQAAAVADRTAAAANSLEVAFSFSNAGDVAAAVPAAAQGAPDVDGSAAAGDLHACAASAGLQVFGLEELQQHAEAAEAALAAGRKLQPHQMAVVPDASRPFTITMTSGRDGVEYVVAHYEPAALQHNTSKLAALLCEVFHGRHYARKMSRVSAPPNERMVMAGMRTPQSANWRQGTRFGRYSGDTGPEADQFAFRAWPDVRTSGGMRAVSELWLDTLPGLFCAQHKNAADKARSGNTPGTSSSSSSSRAQPWRGPPANFPTPCLLGSPFTSLAVTHNYLSHLHAEPREHPFSYIAWLDVLGPRSKMKVGYFWLTPGLAFTPRSGSALYIDVRLVSHCSDPCLVHNSSSALEGRYGAALFIKPSVAKSNSKLWAAFDAHQANSLRMEQVTTAITQLELQDGASDDDVSSSASDEDELSQL